MKTLINVTDWPLYVVRRYLKMNRDWTLKVYGTDAFVVRHG